MNKWYFFNMIVIGFALWKAMTGYVSAPVIFGVLGLLFIFFNWTRHAVFSTIRDSPDRAQKIRFANFSKKVLPFHKWTGTVALVFIAIHATLVINRYGVLLANKKILTGLIAGITLLSLVISGWIRWHKTTPMKRYIHWGLGFAIFFFVIIHLIF